MANGHRQDGKARPDPFPCPVCGTPLEVGLLGIPEDNGEVVQLFTFDYPTSDFHTAIREAEVKEMFAREVVRCIRQLQSST